MNKKLNTVLFMLGATLINVLMVIVGFILLSLLYINFLAPILPAGSETWAFALIFIGAIVLSFVAYRALMKLLEKKIDIEKYFDPIFVRRRK